MKSELSIAYSLKMCMSSMLSSKMTAPRTISSDPAPRGAGHRPGERLSLIATPITAR